MKASKFLTLTIFGISTTIAFSGSMPSEDVEARQLRSIPAQKDLLSLSGVKAAKRLMNTKEVLEEKYKSLAKAQRKQRIAAKKERIECAEKIKRINNLRANYIDTLNVAEYMEVLFLFPKAKNPDLEEAVVLKMNSLQAEKGPRQCEEDQDRKATYISELDGMYYNVAKLAKKFQVKHGQRQVAQKPAPLHVKEIFKEQKPQTRAFAKRIKVWGKINNKAGAAA